MLLTVTEPANAPGGFPGQCGGGPGRGSGPQKGVCRETGREKIIQVSFEEGGRIVNVTFSHLAGGATGMDGLKSVLCQRSPFLSHRVRSRGLAGRQETRGFLKIRSTGKV